MDRDFSKRIEVGLTHAVVPFNLVGAVAFGSRVKDKATPDSDFDLLVVVEGIHPKPHRRGEEIAMIKRSLPPYPFDILLYSESEVTTNFKNHNPVFLDIAEEGEIILDKDDFLKNLIGETRAYIKLRGVQKLSSGWAFPVHSGTPTLLSKISNKDFSVAMLRDGERDFTIGKELSRNGFFDKAVYHFQQAVEKCVKSILIAIGVFQKTHFVGEVLRGYVEKAHFPGKWKEEILEAANISEGIEPEVTLSRYPAIIEDHLWLPFEEYEQQDANRAMEKAGMVLSIAKRFLADWFSEIGLLV